MQEIPELIPVERTKNSWQETFFQEMPAGCAIAGIPGTEGEKPGDFRLITANPAFCTMTGTSPERAEGALLGTLVSPVGMTWGQAVSIIRATGKPALLHGVTHSTGRDLELTLFPSGEDRFGLMATTVARPAGPRDTGTMSREIFLRLADQIHDVLWTADMDMRITYVSPAIRQLRGISPEEAMQESLEDALTPGSYRVLMESRRQGMAMIRQGDPHSPYQLLELEQRRRDGSTVWTEVGISLVWDTAGRPSGVVGVMRDISQRKATEKNLEKTENELARALRAAKVGTWEWDMVTDTITVTTAGQALFGYTGEELRQVLLDPEATHPEERTWLSGIRLRNLEGSSPVREYEWRIRARDGSWRWVSVHGDITARGGDGRPLAMSGTFRDITAEKEAREALIGSEALHRAIVSASPDGIALTDPEGRFTFIPERARALLGIPEGTDPAACHIPDLVDPEQRPRVLEQLASIRDGQVPPGPQEFRVRRLDGSVFWADITFSPVYDGKRQVARVLVIIRDISGRKQTDLALMESERTYRSIIDNMQDIFYRTDLFGKLLLVSPRSAILAGFSSPADMIGSDYSGVVLLAEEDRAAIRLALGTEGSIENYPVNLTTRNGKTFHMTLSAHMLYDALGQPFGTEGVLHDVTAEKEAAEKLSGAYRAFLELGPDPAQNIDTLVRVACQLLGGSFALYRRRENGKMVTVGQWNAPAEFREGDPPDGCLCTEVIRRAEEGPLVIGDLEQELGSGAPPSRLCGTAGCYVGKAVRVGGEFSGSLCIVSGAGSAPTATDLDVLGILAQAVGIEDLRRKVQNKLRESRERYQSLVEATSDMLFVVSPGCTYRYVSPQVTRILGYRPDELLGKTPFQLMPEAVVESEKEAFYAARDARLPFTGKENVFLHKDGHEVTLVASGVPVIGDDGALTGYWGLYKDVTEEKAAQRRLLLSENSYRGLFDTIPLAVFILDRAGSFIDVNQGALSMFGYPRDFYEGKDLRSLSAPKRNDPEERENLLARAYSGEPGRCEFWGVRSDGSEFPTGMSLSSGTYFGRSVGIATAWEMTEQKRTEEALQAANRKLNLLSGITRHDILNQILILESFLALSTDATALPAPECLDRVRTYLSRADRVTRTIRDQITFTRDYEEIGVRAPAWQDVAAVIRDLLPTFPLAGREVDIGVQGIEIYADPMLGKVFYNLIENALQYGGETMTTIRVTSGMTENGLVITLADNGCGIPENDKENLFSKGYGTHTGLGLFLSREILAITRISLTEDGVPGEGARFRISVPGDQFRKSPPQTPIVGGAP